MKKIFILTAILAITGGSRIWAGEETLIPNRLATAKVGEWVSYGLPDGFVQKHTVVERSGDGAEAHLVIRIDNYKDGKIAGTSEIDEIAGEPMAPMPPARDEGAVATVRNEEVVVKGRKVEGLAIDVKKGPALLRTWYLSPEVPVYGLVKRVDSQGNTEFEAIDFGGE